MKCNMLAWLAARRVSMLGLIYSLGVWKHESGRRPVVFGLGFTARVQGCVGAAKEAAGAKQTKTPVTV